MQPPVILPVPLLRTEDLPRTSTHICYASLVVSSPEYRRYYREKSSKGDVVILDHDPKTPRSPISSAYFIAAMDFIRPRAIVLPNRDLDARSTIRATQDLLKYLPSKEERGKVPGRSPSRYIMVLQGVSLTELQNQYQYFGPLVDAIGLPASLEKVGNRTKIAQELGITGPIVFIEVFKDLLAEVPRLPNVDLAWSTLPIRLAYEGRRLGSIHPSPGPLTFRESYIPPLAESNIRQYIQLYTLPGGPKARVEEELTDVRGPVPMH